MFLLALNLPKPLAAQDSSRIVIISPRVGIVIDRDERDKFYLFTRFNNFLRAVFYQSPDSGYTCRIELQHPHGVSDTSIFYSDITLRTAAERINHFEDLMEGKYRMGTDPPEIQLYSGPEIPMTISSKKITVQRSRELLPFDSKDRESFPNVRIGAGISSYSPDFSGLNAAINAIEDRYRNPPFTVTHQDAGFDVSSLQWYSINVRISNRLAVFLETGLPLRGRDQFSAASLSLLYFYYPDAPSWIRPYFGAGIGKYHFSANLEYFVPVDSDYTFLDEIKFNGGGTGYSLMNGVEIGSASKPGLNVTLFVNYLFVPELRKKLPEGVTGRVRLSSFLFGAQVYLRL